LLFEDYRTLRGQYDKIVCIEVFEAVGYEHYDDLRSSNRWLVKPACGFFTWKTSASTTLLPLTNGDLDFCNISPKCAASDSTIVSCACGITTWPAAEGAFRERYISDVQLVLSKATSENQWMNDPQAEPAWLETS
jgi:hypothetical protein